LGLSTWRIPEPKHVAWLNSYSILKVTHKVRVPFIVGDYIDEVECNVLPLEVCELLLGRSWKYDRNVTHDGRANTYSFVHDGKQSKYMIPISGLHQDEGSSLQIGTLGQPTICNDLV
jgi:hypothetical protein